MSLSGDTRRRLTIACASDAASKELAARTLNTTAPQAAIANLTLAYTANNPNIVPNGTVTFANGSTPTVAELLEAVAELNAKLNAALAALRTAGIILP